MNPKLNIKVEAFNILAKLNCTKSKNMMEEGLGKLQHIIDNYQVLSQAHNGALLSNLARSMKLIEYGKITTFIKFAVEALTKNTNGKVIIMCHYVDTIKKLKELFTKIGYEPLVIMGETQKELREEYKNWFQEDNANYRLLIANLSIVSQGINLDDTFGMYPRTLLISPSFKLIQLHQATGRVERAGTKSIPNVNFIYIKDYKQEIHILSSLFDKAKTLKTALSYDVSLPSDYKILEELDDGSLIEKKTSDFM